ncbi:helix-turn-helix transcriptional regulator [Listeria sp. FSL L7-0253]|uniref:helix-turn-helix domain-containing protein n=1 Tax=Listeria cossartiae TaxID=2838249 RepID=UPI0016264F37|nr:helix-turn-helix transcriptional regulator [Listeria cossartiae]MBC2186340.1 helix-turn-helix transcriptional regulator [Listeria cossartiae subsp. cossartiae]
MSEAILSKACPEYLHLFIVAPFLFKFQDISSTAPLAFLVGVNRVTYTNWENRKREPKLDKIVELATEMNTTIDYLLGNSDINLLDTSKKDIQNLTKEEAKELSGALMENMNTIFEAGKEKFNMTDGEI